MDKVRVRKAMKEAAAVLQENPRWQCHWQLGVELNLEVKIHSEVG